MPFTHYRIILRLLSPLHIGKRKYRNLMETREYVPGRTLWGALTARITRDCLSGTPKMYRIVGDKLTEHLRFGYLWPAVKISGKNDGKPEKFEVYFPWKAEERRDTSGSIEFTYKFVEPDAFDYLFKFGYMGQPIETDRKVTEEGQLHESEFIGSVPRDNRKVYLVGDLWINENIPDEDLQDFLAIDKTQLATSCQKKFIEVLRVIMNNLQLGGEKGYGWGRVKYEKLEPTNGEKAIGNVDFIYKEERDKDKEAEGKTVKKEIVLKFNEGQHITAHTLAAGWELPYRDDSDHVSNGKFKTLTPASNEEVQGPIEPLTGYEYRGEYSLISNPPICYEPGSKVKSPIVLTVGKFGILHKGVERDTTSQNGDSDKN